MATQSWGKNNPRWVDAILDWRWTCVIARVALTVPYIVGALTKLSDLHFAVLEQEHFGLYPGLLWALLTIAVEISGPLMVISGRYAWLGAGMLGVFTGLAIKEYGRAEDVAALYAFIASDEARSVNGTAFTIDGGANA